MKKRQLAICLRGPILACAILALVLSVEAKKPPKPPPEPPVDSGVIYAEIEGDVFAVGPDGSAQQHLFSPPPGISSDGLDPSRLLHAGERWFVGWEEIDGTYPDDLNGRLRLVAISEAGHVVPLADDASLQPNPTGVSLCWTPGDTAVSWLAFRWEGAAIVEWGLYALDLAFTADGPVAVGSPGLIGWTSGLFELWYEPPGTPWLEGYYLFTDGYDWSPDGSAIAYTAYPETGGTYLYVADDLGEILQLTDDAIAGPAGPRWSPDGTRIVLTLNSQHQIDVINLVTAERQTLVTTSSTEPGREGVHQPKWSPASTHVAYSSHIYSRNWRKRKEALHVVGADGSGETAVIEANGYLFIHPLGWREE